MLLSSSAGRKFKSGVMRSTFSDERVELLRMIVRGAGCFARATITDCDIEIAIVRMARRGERIVEQVAHRMIVPKNPMRKTSRAVPSKVVFAMFVSCHSIKTAMRPACRTAD